jgi:molybdopterin molybdotransferase
VRRARELGADILVTSGGASVGEYDLVREALAAEGLALSFWKVALRPGRPMMHGRLGAMHVLGLPGNPVSAYVCAVLFLAPLIRQLCGRVDVAPALETARLGCDLPANDERADYLRAVLTADPDGIPVAMPAPVQDSSMLIATLAGPIAFSCASPLRRPRRLGAPCAIIRLAA